MVEHSETQTLVDESSSHPVHAEKNSSRDVQVAIGHQFFRDSRAYWAFSVLALTLFALALLSHCIGTAWASAQTQAQEASTSDVAELDFSEFREFFRAMQAHPIGAKALADANASFSLRRVEGRRILEDLPIPVLSRSDDGSPVVSVSWKQLPQPRQVAEDLDLEPSHRQLSSVSAHAKKTGLNLHMGLDKAPLLQQLSEAMNRSLKSVSKAKLQLDPAAQFSTPESIKGFDITTCFFDAYQTLQYIAYAGLTVYYCTLKQNDEDLAGDITGVIASFSWVGSYMASAFSTCIPPGNGQNREANCASNSLWTEGNFPQLVQDALGIVESCPNGSVSPAPSGKWRLLHSLLQKSKKAAEGKSVSNKGNTAVIPSLPEQLEQERLRRLRSSGVPANAAWQVSQTSCVFDVQAQISFFARFGLQVVQEMQDCVGMNTEIKKQDCAWGVIYAIDNFGWVVEYILQSINDCQEAGNADVLCAEDIADIVFTGSSSIPAVAWMKESCVPPGPR